MAKLAASGGWETVSGRRVDGVREAVRTRVGVRAEPREVDREMEAGSVVGW